MTDQPNPILKTWRLGMVAIIGLISGAAFFFCWFRTSGNETAMWLGLAAFLVVGLFLPMVSNRRAEGDPKFARGYRAASARLLRPGTRLQFNVLLLLTFLLMIPVGRGLGWLRHHVAAIDHLLQPVTTVKQALVLTFIISAALVVGAVYLIRAWRKRLPEDDELI